MTDFGMKLGSFLVGGEVIELIGDVGAGKTTLTKGIALGLGVSENVQSPSFTISQVYEARDNLTLSHYDFYRLNDAGIMSEDLGEKMGQPDNVTVIEWATIVSGILPTDRITISIKPLSDTSRELTINASGPNGYKLEEKL
jgi:tRNA threonylcarbamoyladenosine biosynthesis protein TsaE